MAVASDFEGFIEQLREAMKRGGSELEKLSRGLAVPGYTTLEATGFDEVAIGELIFPLSDKLGIDLSGNLVDLETTLEGLYLICCEQEEEEERHRVTMEARKDAEKVP